MCVFAAPQLRVEGALTYTQPRLQTESGPNKSASLTEAARSSFTPGAREVRGVRPGSPRPTPREGQNRRSRLRGVCGPGGAAEVGREGARDEAACGLPLPPRQWGAATSRGPGPRPPLKPAD